MCCLTSLRPHGTLCEPGRPPGCRAPFFWPLQAHPANPDEDHGDETTDTCHATRAGVHRVFLGIERAGRGDHLARLGPRGRGGGRQDELGRRRDSGLEGGWQCSRRGRRDSAGAGRHGLRVVRDWRRSATADLRRRAGRGQGAVRHGRGPNGPQGHRALLCKRDSSQRGHEIGANARRAAHDLHAAGEVRHDLVRTGLGAGPNSAGGRSSALARATVRDPGQAGRARAGHLRLSRRQAGRRPRPVLQRRHRRRVGAVVHPDRRVPAKTRPGGPHHSSRGSGLGRLPRLHRVQVRPLDTGTLPVPDIAAVGGLRPEGDGPPLDRLHPRGHRVAQAGPGRPRRALRGPQVREGALGRAALGSLHAAAAQANQSQAGFTRPPSR